MGLDKICEVLITSEVSLPNQSAILDPETIPHQDFVQIWPKNVLNPHLV